MLNAIINVNRQWQWKLQRTDCFVFVFAAPALAVFTPHHDNRESTNNTMPGARNKLPLSWQHQTL